TQCYSQRVVLGPHYVAVTRSSRWWRLLRALPLSLRAMCIRGSTSALLLWSLSVFPSPAGADAKTVASADAKPPASADAKLLTLPLLVHMAHEGGPPVADEAFLERQLARANEIFAPYGVRFSLREVVVGPAPARMETRDDRSS